MCPATYLFIGFVAGFIVCDAIFATVVLVSILNALNDIRESFYSNP